MLQATRDLDPVIFERDSEGQFELAVGSAVHVLEQANGLVAAYEGFDRGTAGEGIAKEIEHEGGELAEHYSELSDLMGEDFMRDFMVDIAEEGPPISEEEYVKACADRDGSQIILVDHAVGYHDFMRSKLAVAYGEDGDDVDEEAWLATWKKLRDNLGGEEGTLLAEAASFFDGLVREKYGNLYRPMEEDRGPAVDGDTCARTFYIVMKDHLHRAIVGSSRDEWTGYE